MWHRQFKRGGESSSPQLGSNYNKFTILSSRVVDDISISKCNLNKNTLKEVIVKIGPERIDTQKWIMIEALLDSGVMSLVISSEFARKQEFKLKRIERSIYVKKCGWYI